MARDVDSLVLCMKALLCDEMFCLDPAVPPLPFNDKVIKLDIEMNQAVCVRGVVVVLILSRFWPELFIYFPYLTA